MFVCCRFCSVISRLPENESTKSTLYILILLVYLREDAHLFTIRSTCRTAPELAEKGPESRNNIYNTSILQLFNYTFLLYLLKIFKTSVSLSSFKLINYSTDTQISVKYRLGYLLSIIIVCYVR